MSSATARMSDSVTPGAGRVMAPARAGAGGWTATKLRDPVFPITLLFAWYPIWWILGVQQFIALVILIPMIINLAKKPTIKFPPGFILWALFLMWTLSGPAVLQIHAPGTVDENSMTRYATWAFRYGWYLVGTVALVYIGNNKKYIDTKTISRILGAFFVTVTIGGVVGTFFPHIEFQSLLEILLPGRISNQPFINSLIHPRLAQIQDILGNPAPRPSAPFTYTNDWGMAYALLLPFFIRGWLSREARFRRWIGVPVLALSIIPVVYSANRGLWIALTIMAIFTVGRALMRGRLLTFAGTIAILCVAMVALTASPLGSIIETRIEGGAHNSNQGRTNRALLTIESVAAKSPLVGYGNTRDVQGNFNSIAGGASSLCPHCSPPPLGTQGQLWLVLFSQGIIGLLLFLGFFAFTLVYYFRSRTPWSGVGICVLLANFVTIAVYDSLGIGSTIAFVAVAALWRDSVRRTGDTQVKLAPDPPKFRTTLWRIRFAVIFSCALFGTVGGATWNWAVGTRTVEASAAVWFPDDSPAIRDKSANLSIDTLANLSRSTSVNRAIDRVEDHRNLPTGLSVSATPNTRILHLHFRAPSRKSAEQGLAAAMKQFIRDGNRRIVERKNAVYDEVSSRLSTLQVERNQTQNRIDSMTRDVDAPDGLAILKQRRTQTDTKIQQTMQQAQDISSTPASHTIRTEPMTLSEIHDGRNVAVASGAFSGLLIGVLLARYWRILPIRIRRRSDVYPLTGFPVLAVTTETSTWQRVEESLRCFGPNAYMSADPRDARARRLAAWLDTASSTDAPRYARPRGSGVIIVVSRKSRLKPLRARVTMLRSLELDVMGVVFLEVSK